MPMNKHDNILPKSQINGPSTIKYYNIHSKSKTDMRKVGESSGKLQEERKTVTKINRMYSQIMSNAMDNNFQNMVKNEKETKLKVVYNLLGPMVNKEKSSESGIASQKENKLLKLRNKREAEHFLSVTKREAKSITNRSSTLALEETTLKSEKTKQIISNSAFNSTTIQNVLIRNAPSNSDPVLETQVTLDVSQKEIWFVSDEGSDKYNCQTKSAPCKNLQTVLDRASDGAEIYVTSETLSLDLVNDTVWYKIAFWSWTVTGSSCLINSSLSYTLRSINGTKTKIICSSKYFTIKPI